MTTLFLDPVGGLAGDMILGALLDAGAPEDALRAELAKLPLSGHALEVREETRRGFRGKRVHVAAGEEHAHRHLSHVLSILDEARLPSRARERAGRVFDHLARAEAKIHGTSPERVHFHEVGAIDSIVDITGVAVALELLGVHEIFADRIPLGTGTTTGAHGEFPLPAPAVLELLAGWPVVLTPRTEEQTTPTGAAIVAALGRPGRPPGARLLGRTGIGFGSRQNESGPPNMTRAILVDAVPVRGEIAVVEATVDDMSPEWTGALMDVLFEAGALDVFFQPVHMKKNRAGITITTLVHPEGQEAVARALLTHSTTLGVRVRLEDRVELPRRTETVQTPLGEARVKVAVRPDGRETASPEFEDCRQMAARTGQPIGAVYALVEETWRRARP